MAGALLLLNRPFGFVALLGVIALMGMIMRNSVILIDQIEQDRARGVDAWNAIVESAVRRFRPIVLTAAAAVLAMIPLSRSVFWGPMAVAIMGGLIVATALTLLALPAMYAAWFRVKREHRHRHDGHGSAGAASMGGRRLESRTLKDGARPRAERRAVRRCRSDRARVAKLVDAPGLGPDASNGVPVRVRPRAPVHLQHHESPSWPCTSKPSKSSNAASR